MSNCIDCTASDVIRLPVPAAPAAGPAWSARVIQIADLLATWIARARDRRDLATFNDHQLQDIGVSRSDVARETDKPFWKP
jgi:uncharacterized protein YjiS (DUF1127 family)